VDLINGSASLIFETVKGVQLGFHSRLGEVVARLIEVVEEDEGHNWGARFEIAKSIAVRICEHCRAEQADAMWTALFDVIDAVFADGSDVARQSPRLRDAVYMTAVCVAHRGGTRLRDAQPMMERIGQMLSKQVLAHGDAHAANVNACVALVNVVLRVGDVDQIRRGQAAWTQLFGLKDTGLVLAVCAQLCEHHAFGELYQQHVLTVCEKTVAANDVTSSLALVDCIPRSQRCKIPVAVVDKATSLIQQACDGAQLSPEVEWLALRCIERSAKHLSGPSESFDRILDAMFDKFLPPARQESNVASERHTPGGEMGLVLLADRMSAAQLPRSAHVMLQALAARLASLSVARKGQGSSGSAKAEKQSKRNRDTKGQLGNANEVADVAADHKVLSMVGAVLESFPHSAQVLEVMMPFFSHNSDMVRSAYTLEELAGKLAINLSSPDEMLRNTTLQLLIAMCAEPRGSGCDSMSEREVLELLLSIETAPADAINGKQRNIKLLQLQTNIEYNKIPISLHKLLLPFLVGQLRNRFTMPWPAAVECIGMLAAMHPKVTWSMLVGYLGAYATHDCPHKSVFVQDKADKEEPDDHAEKDREARKGRIGKARAKEERVPVAEDMIVRPLEGENFALQRFSSVAFSHTFAGSTCVDATVQLLKAAGKQPMYVQNHSQPFVTLFLAFLEHQYDPLFEEDTSTVEGKQAEASSYMQHAAITRTEATKVLLGYLELFSQMTSVNPLHKAQELREVFTRLLTKTHGGVQLLALRCLCVWGDEGVIPYKKNLENIIDDVKYRHELSLFQVGDFLFCILVTLSRCMSLLTSHACVCVCLSVCMSEKVDSTYDFLG
jgi:hypothetical protein